jgi:hypothetical protein
LIDVFVFAYLTQLYCSAVLINVNIDRPEANREVLVFPLKDIEGVKTVKGEKKTMHYFGYYIMFPMDIRFILDDETTEHYKARVFSMNQVLLSVPAWPYSPLMNRDEIANLVDGIVTDGMDDARHAFDDNKESRRWKYILLDFPPSHSLGSKEIYDEAGEDEELKLELIPFVYAHKKIPNAVNTIHYAGWKVCRTDIRPTKRGKVEQKENKSMGASLLAGIMSSAPPAPIS